MVSVDNKSQTSRKSQKSVRFKDDESFVSKVTQRSTMSKTVRGLRKKKDKFKDFSD